MAKPRQKRGAYRREDCVFVGVWIPAELMEIIDDFVIREDLDRSKILRRALEEKINREGQKAA
jgi:metal-responsive CopG/Arc/MetJ family transcriptional regulator